MIDIYKASAGSGKTYKLSKTYLNLLLETGDDTAYRNILAVTFTNKATDEMKERILKDLAKEGENNPKAQRVLLNLLHDYSAFSVSTIDTFFQRALHAFSREMGHRSQYQIELDRDYMVKSAMDKLMDEMKPDDKELLDWFAYRIRTASENGSKFSLEKELYQMGSEFINVDEPEELSKDRLLKINEICTDIINSFHESVYQEAKKLENAEMGKQMSNGLQYYLKKTAHGESVKNVTKTLLSGLEKLGVQGEALYALLDPYGESWTKYTSAKIIEDLIFTLGLANDFYKKYGELKEEKSIISLDESTILLKDIIDGSDAPFVYEKIGVRYNHFLLDEFQDTSVVQWDNFHPLLNNSVASGKKNIIVGDVKQSIYRFRNSDWELLDKEIAKDFPGQTEIHLMEDNWRSNKAIVNFNNTFFPIGAERLGLYSSLYKDVFQYTKITDEQSGWVTTDFCEDQLAKTEEYIKIALENGANHSDIAILVRYRDDGGKIADYLLSKGYPIISDDSLKLNSSSMVRRIIATLNTLDSPDDTLNNFPSIGLDIQTDRKYHSIPDLCDAIIYDLTKSFPDEVKGQTLFIQSFMDDVLNWVQSYGNDLHGYLKYFDENRGKKMISSPNDPDAIRITTVHKSKGLAFPIVIFPFAEKVKSYRDEVKWCRLDENHKMGKEFDILFPVNLSKKTQNSYFSKAYEKERHMQLIDNINIFYVCLTRAQKEMHIIADIPPKTIKDISNMSQLLCDNSVPKMVGEPYIFNHTEDTTTPIGEFEATYKVYPKNPDNAPKRLISSQDAWDYFSEEGIGNSDRENGIRLHSLLSEISSLDDMDRVLQSAPSDEAKFLRERILSKKEWFENNAKVLNECSITDAFGKEHRPDRVLIFPNGKVIVIDFKFGDKHQEHISQIKRYQRLFREMGYTEITGYLWYVRENTIEEVYSPTLAH